MNPSYVYFVEAKSIGLVKIGWTKNHPSERLSALQIGSPVVLTPIGIIWGDSTHESRLHKRFKDLRSHGEWFRLEKPLADFIERKVRPWPVNLESIKEATFVYFNPKVNCARGERHSHCENCWKRVPRKETVCIYISEENGDRVVCDRCARHADGTMKQEIVFEV